MSSAAQLWKTRLKCGYTVVLRGIEPLAYSIVSDYIRIVSDYNGCLAIPLNIDTITRSAHRPADWRRWVRLCPVWLWGRYGGSTDADSPLVLALEMLGRLPASAGANRRPVDTVLCDARLLR